MKGESVDEEERKEVQRLARERAYHEMFEVVISEVELTSEDFDFAGDTIAMCEIVRLHDKIRVGNRLQPDSKKPLTWYIGKLEEAIDERQRVTRAEVRDAGRHVATLRYVARDLTHNGGAPEAIRTLKERAPWSFDKHGISTIK